MNLKYLFIITLIIFSIQTDLIHSKKTSTKKTSKVKATTHDPEVETTTLEGDEPPKDHVLKAAAPESAETTTLEPEDKPLRASAPNMDGAVNMKNCGSTRKKSGNIVGGEKAAEGEFPWIVSFQRPKGSKGSEMVHFCGGSIINERWLLTAAHCFQGVSSSFKKMQAVVGTIKWKDSPHKYTLEKAFNHEKYDEDVYANDISLIKTKEPIKIVENKIQYLVNSVCVATPDTKPPESATVYGWGYLKEDGDPSPDLMKVTVNRTDTKECNKVYQEFVGNFTEQMICYMSPGKDACKGDSGGPLTQSIKRRGTQVGVVSFGHGCARPKTPGIYQEVGKFYHWIETTIKNNS